MASSERVDSDDQPTTPAVTVEATTEPGPDRAEPRTLGHVPALDGVRGVAVLLVITTHLMIIFEPRLFFKVLPGAALGVDIFFVLSGFLITSLLLGELRKSGRVSMRGFYKRRARRLLPALVVLLVVHAYYAMLTDLPLKAELQTAAASLFYVANWYRATGHTPAQGLSHLWSLSIEEQFYLVWPLMVVLFFGVRRSLRFSVVMLCTAIVAIVAWRAFLWGAATTHAQVGTLYYRTDTRADGLLIGALASYLWVHGRVPKRGVSAFAWLAIAFIGYCVSRMATNESFYYAGGFALVAAATATIILAIVEGRWLGIRLFNLALLRAVGRCASIPVGVAPAGRNDLRGCGRVRSHPRVSDPGREPVSLQDAARAEGVSKPGERYWYA